MIVQINQEICSGCGICMDTCQSGAIFMDAHQAVVNVELCNKCEACIDACPNEAITAIVGSPPVTSFPISNTVNLTANMIFLRSNFWSAAAANYHDKTTNHPGNPA